LEVRQASRLTGLAHDELHQEHCGRHGCEESPGDPCQRSRTSTASRQIAKRRGQPAV
jgi:hypothetical protein